ncbi:MAG: hypothetical protein MRY79_04650 [Alphaproteobacteria bacterium]|nr:hypothetical protein [Alphaproteobacteria bacterium]
MSTEQSLLTIDPADIPPYDVSQHSIWESYDTPVEYAFCHTDHKSGSYKTSQLNFCELEQQQVIKTMLTDIGLPHNESDFLSGRGYDLLFLKNHGIVIKIGQNHDPIDFIHPCFAQPLGWMNARTDYDDLTLCLYAGEKLLSQDPDAHQIHSEFREVVLRSGQDGNDIGMIQNIGVVNLRGKKCPILIDVDKSGNQTINKKKKELKQGLAQEFWNRAGVNNAQSHWQIMEEVYKDEEEIKPWLSQMLRHQYLRELFWMAQQGPRKEKPQALKRFWDTAASLTVDPMDTVAVQRAETSRTPERHPLYTSWLVQSKTLVV